MNSTNKQLEVFIDDLEGWYNDPIMVKPFTCFPLSEELTSFIKEGDFKVNIIDD